MLHELRTLLWLRFRMFCHAMRSPTKVLSFLARFLIGLAFASLSLLVAVGLFFLGLWAPAEVQPRELLSILDALVAALVFFWLFAIMMAIHRADAIDFRKMLHLPLSPRRVFLLNFASSLLSPAPALCIVSSLGLTLGLAVALGPRMLWTFPFAIAFAVMLAAWIHWARGLLIALMENKRRRRLIIVLLPLFFMLIFQAPQYIMFASRNRSSKHTSPPVPTQQPIPVPSTGNAGDERAEEALRAAPAAREWQQEVARRERAAQRQVALNAWIPLGWFPLGVHGLHTGRPLLAVPCFLGMTLLGSLALGLAYRTTIRYYQGAPSFWSRRRAKRERVSIQARPRRAPRFVTRRLPYVDDDTAAFAWAHFVAYLRHPLVRMSLLMPLGFALMALLVFSTGFTMKANAFLRAFIPPLLPLWCVFMSAMWLFNVFGADGEGFRSLILLPTERRKYLIGKNLAFFPIVAVQVLFCLAAGGVLLRPSPVVLLTALVVFVQIYLTFCVPGNLFSLYFPFRIQTATMRGPQNKGTTILVSLVMMLFTPVLALPALLIAGSDYLAEMAFQVNTHHLLGLAVALVFLAATMFVYRETVRGAGNLLLKREQRILETIVKDRE